MANKVQRSTKKLKAKHRAVKPRPVRPLDVWKEGNHEDRSAARREAHERRMLEHAEAEKARLEPIATGDDGQGCGTPAPEAEA